MEPSRRNLEIDFWKALAVFGVVWIHSSYLIPFQPIYLEFQTPVFKFCVPAFLLFWGYFSERSAQKPDWNYSQSLRRGGLLFVKFLFWSSVYWLLHWDFRLDIVQQISKYWSGYGWSGQYFFVILFQAILAFPVIRLIARKTDLRLNIALVVLVLALANQFASIPSILQKIGDRVILYWVPYMVLGIQLAMGKRIGFKVPIALAVASLPIISLNQTFLPSHLLKIGPYLLPSVFLVTVLIGAASIDGTQKWVVKFPIIERLTQVLAQYSLAIFCINPLVAILTSKWFPQISALEFFGAGWILPVTNTCLVLGISLLIAKGMEKARLGFLVSN